MVAPGRRESDVVGSHGFVFGIRKMGGSHSVAREAGGDSPAERRLYSGPPDI